MLVADDDDDVDVDDGDEATSVIVGRLLAVPMSCEGNPFNAPFHSFSGARISCV